MFECVICGFPTSGSLGDNCAKCSGCEKVAHFLCLTRRIKLTKNLLLGDVFYKLTCRSCSSTGIEVVARDKLSWLAVLIIALYNLQQHPHLSRQGYYHWKLHIADFIDRKWNDIFGSGVKRKKSWHGTVSGTLSHYSPTFFQTGTDFLKEPGWWKLTYSNMTPFKTMNLKLDPSCTLLKKTAGRGPEETNSSSKPYVSFSPENPSFMNDNVSRTSVDVDLDLLNCSDSESLDVDIEMDLSNDQNPFSSSGCSHMDTSLSDLVDLCISSEERADHGRSNYNEMEHSKSNDMELNILQDVADNNERDFEINSDCETTLPIKSLFVHSSRRPLPWRLAPLFTRDDPCTRAKPMAEYDELKFLHKLSKYNEKTNVDVPHNIRRLYRKLCVRREQRHQRLTSFTEKLFYVCNLHEDEASSSNNARTLDRYQVFGCSKGKLKPELYGNGSIIRLIGKVEPTCFVSPYTERLLKPFIRRDYNDKPPRLRLLAAIREKANSNNPFWSQPKLHPIDFSYVQPQHIPAINSLCELFFWPGIDLSESLHYPDFSCVALYRKLVIGFAFMVPDVSNNESYISFLFTHPDWRRAGIATFMLYHIIQTCMGKDVTLHVSVTNPAVILYQKFGFKVEELAQDFYDKYLPNDSKECRHALFLRLSR